MRSRPFISSHLRFKWFKSSNGLRQVTFTLSIHPPSATQTENASRLTPESNKITTIRRCVVVPDFSYLGKRWRRSSSNPEDSPYANLSIWNPEKISSSLTLFLFFPSAHHPLHIAPPLIPLFYEKTKIRLKNIKFNTKNEQKLKLKLSYTPLIIFFCCPDSIDLASKNIDHMLRRNWVWLPYKSSVVRG